jgi:DNA sulfur modification protein DndC
MKPLRQLSLWPRSTLQSAIDQSLDNLRYHGANYHHWAISYSGGKDSTATLLLVLWAIREGHITPPESLTVVYADTRMEFPPLYETAMRLLNIAKREGYKTIVTKPEMDKRFFVYMLGYGVTPPTQRFRWCTEKLKIAPMEMALQSVRDRAGEKLLTLTGVRLGESASRDQTIAVSCSRDSGECGQGWLQTRLPEAISDTLAPLLHWRVCHVYDWIFFEDHGYDIARNIAVIYGGDDVRTGCMGCNLVEHDRALDKVVQHKEWEHLRVLYELEHLYKSMKKPQYRMKKADVRINKNGQPNKKAQPMGPLTLAARRYFYQRVMAIQKAARVELITPTESTRIYEMWEQNLYPQGWSGDEIVATVPVDRIQVTSSRQIMTTPLLI